MESIAITETLPVPGPFWTFNREERNAVAILFGLLTRAGNLQTFAKRVDWRPADLADAEITVEWTLLRDLWHYHSGRDNAAALRTAILNCLQPEDRDRLASCSILEFNSHFGAVPRPSSAYVQSPSNWHVARLDAVIPSNDGFRRACRFKWAFNVKPDLVIQTPSGHVLCVEAKWESGEGTYPTSEAEKAIFRGRTLSYLSQTEVQRYLVRDVLGFTGSFAYLARSQFETAAGRCITWGDLLRVLDRSGAPSFIGDWCEQAIQGSIAAP